VYRPLTFNVRLGGMIDEEIADIVRQHGWYAANVNDADPPFLYTIGLMDTCKHPEFIIFGLDADNAYALFAGLIADIRNGQSYSQNGVRTIELGGEKHQVGFRRVHPTQHSVYLGFALCGGKGWYEEGPNISKCACGANVGDSCPILQRQRYVRRRTEHLRVWVQKLT
jgi:hypothetical protein